MSDTLDRYTTALARRLRLRGLPDDEIRRAVTKVETHVRESGSSPTEAFGSPRRYAHTFSSRVPRYWPLYIAALVIATLAASLLLLGLQARGGNEAVFGSLDAMAAIVIGGAVLALWGVGLLALLIRTAR